MPRRRRDVLERDLADELRLAGLEQGGARAGLGDRPHDDAVEVRPAVPVVGVRLQDQLVAARPAPEAERPGAGRDDARGGRLLHRLRALDRPEAAVGHVVEQRADGLLRHEADHVLARDLDRLHATVGEPPREQPVLRVQRPVDVELDGLGVERRPVVELHPPPQVEGPRPAVRRRLPALGEARDDLELLVVLHQPVEDVPAQDHAGQQRERPVDVGLVHVLVGCPGEHAAALGLGGRPAGQDGDGHDERHGGQDGARYQTHGWSPPWSGLDRPEATLPGRSRGCQCAPRRLDPPGGRTAAERAGSAGAPRAARARRGRASPAGASARTARRRR